MKSNYTRHNISLIGCGNLAKHLAPALENAGHRITEVYGRRPEQVRKLTERLYDATPKYDTDFSESKSELFLIAVSDDAIEEVAQKLIVPPQSVVIHTSGSKPVGCLQFVASRTGVFYPVQTFTQGRNLDFSCIPICVESPDRATEALLSELAESISRDVYEISSDQRKILHIAAIFASNFVNHLLGIANFLLEKDGLEYAMVQPLIRETIEKTFKNHPFRVQTGPAARRDISTIKAHLEYLEKDPLLQKIYKTLTESIMNSNRFISE